MRLRVALAACVLATFGVASTTPPANAADAVRARKMTTLTNPVALAIRAGEAKVVYIASKDGLIRRLTILNNGGVAVDPTVVLDLSDRVVDQNEQGLLGIAFAPGGAKLYAFYTNTTGDNGVYEYAFAGGVADKASERLVLPIPHPGYINHNGGNIKFGRDDFLYVGTGDGGGGGDPDQNAQDLSSLLGKILRINPALSGGNPYSIPAGNPFVGVAGARPEIWHFGLRNPWRWSFDRSNGDLWIGDVGQKTYEEINRVAGTRKGANFGWNLREGRHPYNGGATPPGAVDPVFEYTHANGNCSVTGGYVYRGSRIAGFQGTYVFADFCAGNLRGRSGTTVRNLNVHIDNPSSFGQDASGELWVLSLQGPVYRLVRKA